MRHTGTVLAAREARSRLRTLGRHINGQATPGAKVSHRSIRRASPSLGEATRAQLNSGGVGTRAHAAVRCIADDCRSIRIIAYLIASRQGEALLAPAGVAAPQRESRGTDTAAGAGTGAEAITSCSRHRAPRIETERSAWVFQSSGVLW